MATKSLWPMLALLLGFAGNAGAQDCVPPKGFVDIQHPSIVGSDHLVSHTEQITVNHSLAECQLDTNAKTDLKNAIHKAGSLPGVAGTHLLGEIPFGTVGSHRLVCLSDGSTLEGNRFWKMSTRAKPPCFAISCGITRPVRQNRLSTVSVSSTMPKSALGAHASRGPTHSSSRAMSFPVTSGLWAGISSAWFFSTGNMRR